MIVCGIWMIQNLLGHALRLSLPQLPNRTFEVIFGATGKYSYLTFRVTFIRQGRSGVIGGVPNKSGVPILQWKARWSGYGARRKILQNCSTHYAVGSYTNIITQEAQMGQQGGKGAGGENWGEALWDREKEMSAGSEREREKERERYRQREHVGGERESKGKL